MHLKVRICNGLFNSLLWAGQNGLPPTTDTLHLGCSYHLHSSHHFLSTWGAVMLEKNWKKKWCCDLISLSVCVICVVYLYPPLLSLSWFMCVNVSQSLSLDSFCCQPLRSPTPVTSLPSHSTILPLAHFLEVTQPTISSTLKSFLARSYFLATSATTCPHTALLILNALLMFILMLNKKKKIHKKTRKKEKWCCDLILLSVCVMCVVYLYPPLCLSWFCQCSPISFFCCQTLRSPTPVPPHSTILPLAHLEVVTADSLPTSVAVTVEASPIRSVDTTEGSFTRLPLTHLKVAQPTVSSNSHFLKALPSQKPFLGEVSDNLPPHSWCAVDVYFDVEKKVQYI